MPEPQASPSPGPLTPGPRLPGHWALTTWSQEPELREDQPVAGGPALLCPTHGRHRARSKLESFSTLCTSLGTTPGPCGAPAVLAPEGARSCPEPGHFRGSPGASGPRWAATIPGHSPSISQRPLKDAESMGARKAFTLSGLLPAGTGFATVQPGRPWRPRGPPGTGRWARQAFPGMALAGDGRAAGLLAPSPRCPHQGLQRLLWASAPEDVAGAARLFRWWGKVGMSSGSQGKGFSLK